MEKVHVNVTETGKLAQQLLKSSRSHEVNIRKSLPMSTSRINKCEGFNTIVFAILEEGKKVAINLRWLKTVFCFFFVETYRTRRDFSGLELYYFEWLCYFFKCNSPLCLSLCLSHKLRLHCPIA